VRTGGEPLELIERHGRMRHYLAGRVVQGGDPIDLCFSGGWVTGRYEWSGQVHEPPLFYYSIELMAEGQVAQGTIEIPNGALLRWPEHEEY
jgi:hypothetical protein